MLAHSNTHTLTHNYPLTGLADVQPRTSVHDVELAPRSAWMFFFRAAVGNAFAVPGQVRGPIDVLDVRLSGSRDLTECWADGGHKGTAGVDAVIGTWSNSVANGLADPSPLSNQ